MTPEDALEPIRIFEFEFLLSPRYGGMNGNLTDMSSPIFSWWKKPHDIPVRFAATDVHQLEKCPREGACEVTRCQQ